MVKVKPVNEEEMKTRVMQLQYLENQLSTTQQQVLALERALLDVLSATSALETYSKLSSEANSIMPLGGGVFVEGAIKKGDKVLVDVGMGVVLEKSISDATKILQIRQKDLETNLNKLQNIYRNISAQHHEMSEELKQQVK